MSLEAFAALTAGFLYYGKLYFNGKTCNLVKDLTGKTIIITGASSGIGFQTAKLLAKMNPTIIMACRNEQKSLPLLKEIQKETNNQNIHLMKMDIADLDSIKSFSEEFKKNFNTLDVLINNAGLVFYEREFTKDGFEKNFMSNYLGHYYLSNLLVEPLTAAKNSRVISVVSFWYKQGAIRWEDLNYDKKFSSTAYFDAKLAQVMFTQEFNKRYEKQGIKAVCLHPGAVRTPASKYYLGPSPMRKFIARASFPIYWFITRNAIQGSQTTLQCTLEDFDKLHGGGYYSDCEEKPVSSIATNEEQNKKLWEISKELIADKGHSFKEASLF